nr:O-acyltransferase like protein-like [Paramormyrops kingsleyae]
MMLQLSVFILQVTVFSCVHIHNVTQKCLEDTEGFLSELHNDRPSKYAMLMYDAFGKMGSDVVGGNVNRPGSLQECLLVHGPAFNGQFCQVFLKQESIQYFVDICVPGSCNEDEVQALVVYNVFQKDGTSLIPPIPSMLLIQSSQAIYKTQCFAGTVSKDFSAVICLFLCCLLMILPLLASIYITGIKWKRQRGISPGVNLALNSNLTHYGTLSSSQCAQTDCRAPETTQTACGKAKGEDCLYDCLQSFSLQRTTAGVLNTASNGQSYLCLNGIRILSLLWIISGHSVQLSVWNNIDNDKRWKEAVEKNPLYIFSFSGPVYLAVDTFLLLGGLLSAKSLLASIEATDDKLSPALVAKFLFKRFKRVQPLQLFIVCLVIGLFSVIPKGPFWVIVEDQILSCKTYWWSNLLLINNLLDISDVCAPWTWYLSIDFQFFISTPLLIFIYRLNKYALLAVASFFLVTSCLSSALLTTLLHLPVHQPTTQDYETYFQYYYNKPYTRYGPYLVGILVGIFMKTKQCNLLNHKWKVAVGWASCLSIMALLVGLAYALRGVPSHPSVPHSLYQGLHRTLWAMSVAWIILACEEGYGGLVNRILSLNMWIPLSNISFACYLIHPVLIILYNGKQETAIHYTDLNFFYLFMGHTALTVTSGYILTVLIERPFSFLKSCSK